MSRNVLLVGDLRSANNYGAIGTSTELIKLLSAESYQASLTMIDGRSLYNEAPCAGWPSLPSKTIQQYAYDRVSLPASTPLSRDRVIRFVKSRMRYLGTRGARRLRSFVIPDKSNSPSLFDRIPRVAEELDPISELVSRGKLLRFEAHLINEAEVVVINGEGNLVKNIHNPLQGYRPQARTLLLLAYYAAAKAKKPTAFVNHVFDPGDKVIEDMACSVYRHCRCVWCRDQDSTESLKSLGVSQVEFVPDALFGLNVEPDRAERFFSVFRFGRPLLAFGDSAALPYVPWDVAKVYGDLFDHARRRGYDVVFVDGGTSKSTVLRDCCAHHRVPRIGLHNCDYEELAAILSRCIAFVSGRWHASILASLGGTPCVLYGTDSHKTAALRKMLRLTSQFYALDSLPEWIDSILEDVDQIRRAGSSLRGPLLGRTSNYARLVRRYQQLPQLLAE